MNAIAFADFSCVNCRLCQKHGRKRRGGPLVNQKEKRNLDLHVAFKDFFQASLVWRPHQGTLGGVKRAAIN